MKVYNTTKSIDMQLSEQREEQLSQRQQRVQKNRAVVSRLLSVTQLLAKCGAPFRGHDESESSDYRGLYREVVAWGAEKDPVLAQEIITTQPYFTKRPNSVYRGSGEKRSGVESKKGESVLSAHGRDNGPI